MSCSLVVDTDSLNAGCPSGTKLCNGECVDLTPEVGCGRAGCLACFLADATPRCSNTGECVIGACHSGFDNCDGDSSNGCETDKRQSNDHCGACNNKCIIAHATPDCANGICAILNCDDGFDNCDGSPTNGCESDLGDEGTCGNCDTECTSGQTCGGPTGAKTCR